MDLNQQLNKRLEEKFIATTFPYYLPEQWYRGASLALDYASPINLGIMGPEMQALENKVNNREQMTMYEFACLNTLIEKVEKRRFQYVFCGKDEYYDLLKITAEYAQLWNKVVEGIQKIEQDKILEERSEQLNRKNMAQA